MSFLLRISLALWMLKRRRGQKTNTLLEPRDVLPPTWCRKMPTSPRKRTKSPRLPTSRRRKGKRWRKLLAGCAARLAIGPIAAHNTKEIRTSLDRAPSLSTWLLAILKEELLGTVIYYLLFSQYLNPMNGGLIRVLIFMCVLISPCLPLISPSEAPPS